MGGKSHTAEGSLNGLPCESRGQDASICLMLLCVGVSAPVKSSAALLVRAGKGRGSRSSYNQNPLQEEGGAESGTPTRPALSHCTLRDDRRARDAPSSNE